MVQSVGIHQQCLSPSVWFPDLAYNKCVTSMLPVYTTNWRNIDPSTVSMKMHYTEHSVKTTWNNFHYFIDFLKHKSSLSYSNTGIVFKTTQNENVLKSQPIIEFQSLLIMVTKAGNQIFYFPNNNLYSC